MSKFYEPVILVFEGAPTNILNKIHAELYTIFKGTKYEDHYFVTNQLVKGIENPYIDKLDKMIKILETIRDQQ